MIEKIDTDYLQTTGFSRCANRERIINYCNLDQINQISLYKVTPFTRLIANFSLSLYFPVHVTLNTRKAYRA